MEGLLGGVAVALEFGFACSWGMATVSLAVRNTEAIQAFISMG